MAGRLEGKLSSSERHPWARIPPRHSSSPLKVRNVIAGDVLDHEGLHLDVTSAESWASAVARAMNEGRADDVC